MSTEPNLGPRHYAVLDALRNQSALTRTPGPLTSDGHVNWHTLLQLEEAGEALGDYSYAVLEPAARTLRKVGLVHMRTLHTHLYWCITEAGRLTLEQVERDAGVSEGVAANIAYAQAAYDVARLQEELADARARSIAALDKLTEQRELLGWPGAADIIDRASKAGAK
jgi:hypothetical protein